MSINKEYINSEMLIFYNSYPEFSDLPTLDINVFQDLRISIDDDLLFSDLVTIYLNSAETLLDTIQISFVNYDAAKFSISCHSLKSTSASIGARKLACICKYLEEISKSGSISVSKEYLSLVSSEYDQAVIAIKDKIIQFMK
ncbi:Hpt domain-containing protein [Pseudanabaena biceps]|nr:Hpt domain-containing protein [Pseudanabaena biceps]